MAEMTVTFTADTSHVRELLDAAEQRIRFLENRQQELLEANNREVELRRDLTRRMREAAEMVETLHCVGNFANGNTDPAGSFDEGEVRAYQLANTITDLLKV